jgi:hypothetical protein
MTTWRVRTLYANGSVCTVVVATYRRCLELLENAKPGETISIDQVGQPADAPTKETTP